MTDSVDIKDDSITIIIHTNVDGKLVSSDDESGLTRNPCPLIFRSVRSNDKSGDTALCGMRSSRGSCLAWTLRGLPPSRILRSLLAGLTLERVRLVCTLRWTRPSYANKELTPTLSPALPTL